MVRAAPATRTSKFYGEDSAQFRSTVDFADIDAGDRGPRAAGTARSRRGTVACFQCRYHPELCLGAVLGRVYGRAVRGGVLVDLETRRDHRRRPLLLRSKQR